MAKFHVMPQATPTMKRGLIVAWLKEEGDSLEPQDAIAEVETDKASQEIEVFDPGVLLKILVATGIEAAPGEPIAVIGTSADETFDALMETYEAQCAAAIAAVDGEEVSAEATEPALAAPTAVAAKPRPAPVATGPGYTHLNWQGAVVDASVMEPPGLYLPPEPAVRASPVARKVAAARGVALETLRGSGPHGRIVKADVEQAATGAGISSAPLRNDETVRNSQMRKAIARRLLTSHTEAPTFFLTARLTCDRLVDIRAQLKAGGLRVSYNDLLLRAVAKALVDVPEVNASWSEQAITRFGRVDIGVAVALKDGLITPVIRNADRKSVGQIGAETRSLAERAKSGKLEPDEYTGSTFTVSNLGMMQIEHFTAILNPPEAAILAVGALVREPIAAEDGSLYVSWQMKVTMTCDHRVIDGALGARYLQSLRGYIEQPALLLI